jgi:hypothetical protein
VVAELTVVVAVAVAVDDEMLFSSPVWGRFALGFRDFFFWEVVG